MKIELWAEGTQPPSGYLSWSGTNEVAFAGRLGLLRALSLVLEEAGGLAEVTTGHSGQFTTRRDIQLGE